MAANTDNVILLPWVSAIPQQDEYGDYYQPLHPQSKEAIDLEIERATARLYATVVNNLLARGYDVADVNNSFMKDLALLAESIRSIVSKYYEVDHKMQHLSNDLFDISVDHNGNCIIYYKKTSPQD